MSGEIPSELGELPSLNLYLFSSKIFCEFPYSKNFLFSYATDNFPGFSGYLPGSICNRLLFF